MLCASVCVFSPSRVRHVIREHTLDLAPAKKQPAAAGKARTSKRQRRRDAWLQLVRAAKAAAQGDGSGGGSGGGAGAGAGGGAGAGAGAVIAAWGLDTASTASSQVVPRPRNLEEELFTVQEDVTVHASPYALGHFGGGADGAGGD